MSDEDDDTPPGLNMFSAMFAPPTEAQIEEAKVRRLDQRRKAQALAKAALPTMTELTRNIRELQSIFDEAPVRSDEAYHRLSQLRKHAALLRDQLEAYAT